MVQWDGGRWWNVQGARNWKKLRGRFRPDALTLNPSATTRNHSKCLKPKGCLRQTWLMHFEFLTQLLSSVEGVLPVNYCTHEATEAPTPIFFRSLSPSLSLSLPHQHSSIALLAYSLHISPYTQTDVCSSPGVMLITPSNSHSSLLSYNTSQYFTLFICATVWDSQSAAERVHKGQEELNWLGDRGVLSRTRKHTQGLCRSGDEEQEKSHCISPSEVKVLHLWSWAWTEHLSTATSAGDRHHNNPAQHDCIHLQGRYNYINALHSYFKLCRIYNLSQYNLKWVIYL